MRPTWKEQETQRLINIERTKRHIPAVQWDPHMHELARNHSEAMARARKLFHSNRIALEGGENCFMGSSSPREICKGWMSSKQGHREWLLDPRVKGAAVGISNGGHGRGYHTYVAWSFVGGVVPSFSHSSANVTRVIRKRSLTPVLNYLKLPKALGIPQVLRGTLRIPRIFYVPDVVRFAFQRIHVHGK